MSAPPSQDITVVGAGVVGICCALHLARGGHRVTVLDRAGVAEGCSKGNAGLFETNGVAPVASPGTIRKVPGYLFDPLGPLAIKWAHLPGLAPWLLRFLRQGTHARARANAASMLPLVQRAMPAYEPLLEIAGAADLVRETGWVWVFEHERTYHGSRWDRQLLDRLGIRYHPLDGDALFEYAPALTRRAVRGLYFPSTRACVNPYRFVQVLARALERHGGRIEHAEVERIEPDRTGSTLHLHGETRRCEHVVIACGAWSARLARQLGEPVPLSTERGYHVTLPDPQVEVPVPLKFSERQFVTNRMEHGLRFAGTAEFGGLNRPPDWRRADALLRHGRRLLPGLNETGATRWMGFRPTMPDSRPVIGPSARHKRVYYAFGHQHLGLTLAGVTGELIAALVDGDTPPIPLEPYRVNRF